jgi:hypothetical protein
MVALKLPKKKVRHRRMSSVVHLIVRDVMVDWVTIGFDGAACGNRRVFVCRDCPCEGALRSIYRFHLFYEEDDGWLRAWKIGETRNLFNYSRYYFLMLQDVQIPSTVNKYKHFPPI